MSAAFQTVLRMSLMGSYVFLILCLLRLVMRKLPSKFSYCLWTLVFLRLALPVFWQGNFSLIPERLQNVVTVENNAAAPTLIQDDGDDNYAPEALIPKTNQEENRNIVTSSGTADYEVKNPAETDLSPEKITAQTRIEGGIKASEKIDVVEILGLIWIVGAGVLFVYYAAGYIGLKRRLRSAHQVRSVIIRHPDISAMLWMPVFWIPAAVLWCVGGWLFSAVYVVAACAMTIAGSASPGRKIKIYETGGNHLSFVMGLIKPSVYLTGNLPDKSVYYIVKHEGIHIRRMDYLIKPLALVVVCIHWFNPLVWCAFYLMSRDMEISCDELAIQSLGDDKKEDYSRTLLQAAMLSGRKQGRTFTAGTLLSFGEDSVKSRVRHVLKYRKAPIGIAAAAVVLAVVLAAGLNSLSGKESRQAQDGSVNTVNNDGRYEVDRETVEEFTDAVRKAGNYGDDVKETAFATDYDGDTKPEAFVEIGMESEDTIEGDLWFVSSEGEAVCLKKGLSFEKEPEYLETSDGNFVLITYQNETADTMVYGVNGEGMPCAYLTDISYAGEKYADGNTLICMIGAQDAGYDINTGEFQGKTAKAYPFYYDGEAFRLYAAREISREDVKNYKNGQGFLRALEQARPGCLYQYLLRDNRLIQINQAEETEEGLEFYCCTLRNTEEGLIMDDQCPGCYFIDPVDAGMETFEDYAVNRHLEEKSAEEGMADFLGSGQRQRAFAEWVRQCLEQEDWESLYDGLSVDLRVIYDDEVYLGLGGIALSEKYLQENVDAFVTGVEENKKLDDSKASEIARYPLRFRSHEWIFGPEVTNAVMQADFNNIFGNWQGVCIGDGVIWFEPAGSDLYNKDYVIFSINVPRESEGFTDDTSAYQQNAGSNEVQDKWTELAKEQGLSENQAQELYSRFENDGLLTEDYYECRDFRKKDLDGDGQEDYAAVFGLRAGAITPGSYEMSRVAIYINGGLAYKKAIPDGVTIYGFDDILSGDVDDDGLTEVVYDGYTGGNGASGSFYKEILKYRNGSLTPMKFPNDLDIDSASEDILDPGLFVEVRIGKGGIGSDSYEAYCPYLDQTVEYTAENARMDDGSLYDSNMKKGDVAGGNVRGYSGFEIVTRDGREYLRGWEYLSGEIGIVQNTGIAWFLMDWNRKGEPEVLEFTVE